MSYNSIKEKVQQYNTILKNTKNYRQVWCDSLKQMIIDHLNDIIKTTKLNAFVEHKDEIENLEIINFSLGTEVSGIAEKFPGNKTKRPFIKSSGSLVFQQLFNGKILIMIMYPYIEGYGQPKNPKTLEILRPRELQKDDIVQYVETFLKEIIEWEDFDDDAPEKMGANPIGFAMQPQ